MPEPRKPCPCPRCKGALVSSRTVRNHRSRLPPARTIISFPTWSAHFDNASYRLRYPDGHSSDGDLGGPSHKAHVEGSRSSKRPRHDYPDQEEEEDDFEDDSDQLATSSGTDGDVEDPLVTTSCIKDIKITQAFTKEIQDATLDNGNLDDDVLEHLHNPPEEPTDISDPDTQLSLDLYLAVTNSSEYKYSTKKLVAENLKGKGRAVPILHAEHMTDVAPTALPQAAGTIQPTLSLPPATGTTAIVSESTQSAVSSLPLVAMPAVSVFIQPPSTAPFSESAQPVSFSSLAAITHVVPPSIARNLKRDRPMVASPTLLSARNLFALEYLKEHTPTTSEFKIIWDNTSSETKMIYVALSKERKSAARLTVIAAVDSVS